MTYGYSTPSLDTSFHDHEMNVGGDDMCECCGKRLRTLREYQVGVHNGACKLLLDGPEDEA